MLIVSDEVPYLPMEHRSLFPLNDNTLSTSVLQIMQGIPLLGIVIYISSIKQILSYLLIILLHSGRMPISISLFQHQMAEEVVSMLLP